MFAWCTKAAIKGFFGQYWLQLVILAALIGAVLFIDHRGYARAQAEDKARELERAELTAAAVGAIDKELDQRLAKISADLGGRIDTIDKEGKTIVQPIITSELVRDPRLARPDSCLSPGLLAAVNAARGNPAGELGRASRPGDPQTVPGSPKGH